jgi:tetratricopeptide (TPR) repeat protein
MPHGWRETSLTGDADVGLDMQIQVVEHERYQHMLLAQIKGSTTDNASADKAYFSVALKVSTANYLSRVTHPVMLVYADFSSDPEPASVPIYYLWLNEPLQKRLDEVRSAATDPPVELTFRVPASQRITPVLDIVGYLKEDLRRRESLASLQRAIVSTELGYTPPDALGRLAENIQKRGAVFLESALGESDVPWADAQVGSNAWMLRQLQQAILDGAERDASQLAANVAGLTLRDETERAEFQFLLGRLETLRGQPARAIQHYREALAVKPTGARFLCALIEARLRVEDHVRVATEGLETLARSTLASDPKVVALRARLLTIHNRYDEAQQLLDGLPPRHRILEGMLLATLLHDRDRIDRQLQEAHALNLPRQTMLSVRILAARALFWETFRVESGVVIPASGPPLLDVRQLSRCWTIISELATELRASRWPVNSELLMDVLAPVALTAGRANEGLLLLDDFLRERPHFNEFQLTRVKLAIFAEKYAIALQAVSALPDPSARAVHEVLVHYERGDYHGAVEAIDALLQIPVESEWPVADALVVAALCAQRTFNKQARDACLDRLRTIEGSQERLLLFEFAIAASAGGTALEEGLARLCEAYARSPDSIALQDHLFTALRATKADDAALVLRIADQVQSRRLLVKREVIQLAQSLSALGRRTQALSTLGAARERLPDDLDLASLQALLFEKDGNAKLALEVLTSILKSHTGIPVSARSTYINLASRSGLTEQAIRQFEALLARESDRKEQRELLRGIFSLELHRGAESQRLTSLAFDYGELVDRDEEFDEAMFLQMVVTAGMRASKPLTDVEHAAFGARTKTFLEKFPDSKYFSVVEFPSDGGPEVIQDVIRKKLKYTDEQITEFERVHNQLARGELVAPYAWRPRHLLRNVASVPHLWELTKRSSIATSKAYTLLLAPKVRDGIDRRQLGKVPLVDLPTLLLLTDLDLWDVTLKLFDVIAISKLTLMRIQAEAGPLGFPTDTLLRLRQAIAADIDRIWQPGSLNDDWLQVRDGGLEDFKAILADPRYAFFSDDFLSRVLVQGELAAAEAIITPDIIESAERAGWLSIAESARRYAKLVTWNVAGAPIYYKHLIAAIPKAIEGARTVDERVGLLFADPVFRPLVDAAWSHDKPYQALVGHFSAVLARIVNESPRVDDRTMAAIFVIWLDKVALRSDIQVQPGYHAAYALMLAFLAVDGADPRPRVLWNTYNRVVEHRHGDKMDKAREREGIGLVGEIVAETVNQKEELSGNVDELLAKMKRGMTEGTGDYEHFDERYNSVRAAGATGKRNR